MRNYAQLFAICKKHGLDYKDKVAEFTNNRTDSLRALTDGEYREFMIRMQLLNPSPPPNPQRGLNGFTPKPGDAQRKKMIGIARDMRWDIPQPATSNASDFKRLMQRLDTFCLTKTKYKKKLNDLSVDELNKAVYIFEHEIKKSFLNSI